VTQYHPHVCGVAVAGLAAALVIAGCGAGAAHRQTHLPGAEPAVSPPLQRAPAGRIVRVGAAAEGIIAVPRAGVVAVAVRDPDRITLLSLSSGAVVRALRIAGPARHLALDGPRTLLVPEAPINRLLELSLRHPSSGARSVRTGSLPHDAVALAGRIFVADEFGRAVSVISGGHAVARIGPFTQPGGIAAVAGRIALVDVGADTVSLLDPRTLRILARARAGAGPTHDAAGPDGRLYVVDTRGGELLTFATRPRLALINRLALPGRPYGIVAEPGRDRLWVTETGSNTLVELAIGSPRPRVLQRIATVRQPNSVAADPTTGEVFVAGAAAGVVEEIHPGS
jgi:DNA-binding beta-propeller fold protein YncE